MMVRISGAMIASITLVGHLPATPHCGAAEAKPTVCVVEIREEITHNTLYLVRRALREAHEKGASVLVLDMDTNGGRVDATEEIVRVLEKAPIKTYTFVNKKAFSAGAYISAATDKIFMAPGSVIGDAKPILMVPGSGVQETPKSYEEKLSSAMRALVRASAQLNGHNPDVFEAMVDEDKGLKIGDVVICEKGKLLTLTTEEAAKEYGDPPRPLLSAGTVETVDQLLTKTDVVNPEIFTVAPTGFELVGRWITMISPLLMLVGFVAIYLELKAPGLGAPTVVGIACFGIYFIGNFIAGLAGWEEAVLFAVGVVLLAIEVFVLPGFGVAGVLGVAAILVSLVLGMTEKMPGGPVLPSWPQLQLPLLNVGIGLFGSVVVMMILARYLPRTALFRQMELSATTSAARGYTSSLGSARSLIGAIGSAETMLRPAGKGRFDQQLVDVVTEGDLIEKGSPIKITQVEGSRVVVARAKET